MRNGSRFRFVNLAISLALLASLLPCAALAYWEDERALQEWRAQSDFESVTASSIGPDYIAEANIDYSPESAVDSDWYSTWVSKTNENEWLKVTFKREKLLSEIIFLNMSEGADQIKEMDIEFSDGSILPYTFPRPDFPREAEGHRTLHGEQRTLFYNFSVNAGEAFPYNQGPHRITFEPRRVKWVKFSFTDAGDSRYVTVTDIRFREVQPEIESTTSLRDLRTLVGQAPALVWGQPEQDRRFRNEDFAFDISRSTGMMTNLASLRPFETPIMTAFTYPRVEVSSVWMNWDLPRGECLIDDDIGTDWASHREGVGAWFKIYLAEREIVSKLLIQRSAAVPNNVKQIRLDFEDNSYVYYTLTEEGTATLEELIETVEFEPRATRWVKVTATDVKDPGGNVRLGAAQLYCLRDEGEVEVPTEFRPASLGLYLWNRDTGQRYHLDRLIAYVPIRDGSILSCMVAGVDERGNVPAYAWLTYSFDQDLLKVKAEVTYLVSSPAVWEVGVYQPFDHRTWPTHVDTAGPMDSDNAYGRAFNSHYIEMLDKGEWGGLVYPMGMLTRDDRALMYGDFDLMTYTVSYPHHVPDTTPHFIVSPIGIENGGGWTFDLFYKIHAASPDAYADALRWYVSRTHMDHPDLVDKGIEIRLKGDRASTIPEGCIAGYVGDWSIAVAKKGPAKFRELIEAEEEGMIDLKMTNRWCGPFPAHTRRETFPIDGEFTCQAAWSEEEQTVTYTPQELIEDIRRLQSKGSRLYLYARQMSMPEGHHRWLDYAVPELREWYMDHLKAAIEFYGFDGIAWDYAWSSMGPMCGGRYFSGDPNMTMMHGYLVVQAQMRQWLDETYPDNYKPMLGNLSQGGACSLFYDAALQEGQTTLLDSLQFDALMTPQSGYFGEGYLEGRLGQLWEDDPIEKRSVTRRLFLNNVIEAQGRGVSLGGHLFKIGVPDRKYAESLPWWGNGTNCDGLTDTLRNLAHFGARAISVPRISGNGIIATNCPSVESRLWGDEDNLLATVYNDSVADLEYRVRISRSGLAEYGVDEVRALNATLIGRDGVPVPGADFEQITDSDYVYLEGKLAGKHLLLLESSR